MIVDDGVTDIGRNPGEPLNTGCEHKITEDCLVCSICERCREDLDEGDTCMECGGDEELGVK